MIQIDMEMPKNCLDCNLRYQSFCSVDGHHEPHLEKERCPLKVTPQPRWIPVEEKYEHHIDHTDCIWYGNDGGCPVTCSQYRDGWNDAMEYIFKDGKGYQPYRREE